MKRRIGQYWMLNASYAKIDANSIVLKVNKMTNDKFRFINDQFMRNYLQFILFVDSDSG